MSNVVKKVGQQLGVVKKKKEAPRPVAMAAPEPVAPVIGTTEQRAEAARRRSRRGGRRGLMYASRLGGGERRGTAQEEQTTLGPM